MLFIDADNAYSSFSLAKIRILIYIASDLFGGLSLFNIRSRAILIKDNYFAGTEKSGIFAQKNSNHIYNNGKQ